MTHILVSLVFLASGISKLIDMPAFHRIIEGFDILPGWAVSPASLAVVIIELLCGGCLLAGFFVKQASLALVFLLTVFLVVAVPHLPIISGNPAIDCGCFGAFVSSKVDLFFLARNLSLLIACFYLHFSPHTHSKFFHNILRRGMNVANF